MPLLDSALAGFADKGRNAYIKMGQESEPPLPFPLESSPKHVWTTIRGDYKGNGDSSQWVRVDASRCVAASVVTALHHIRIWFNLVVPVVTWKTLNYCISIQFNLVESLLAPWVFLVNWVAHLNSVSLRKPKGEHLYYQHNMRLREVNHHWPLLW